MEDFLIQLLSTFNYPVIRQGSLAEDEEYPDTFFTFWNRYTDGQAYYDNEMASYVASYYVNVYSTSPETAFSLLRQARQLLVTNGFNALRLEYDLESDEITHIGRGMEVQYLEFEED